MNLNRCYRLIKESIAKFDLNLSDLVVLTEAATSYYALTPLIAALAGAKKVFAVTYDSSFGKSRDIHDATLSLARRWDVENRIKFFFSKETTPVEQADIVTNLGFLRPLDAIFLHRLKATAVIPLMWETWEYREQDLDLRACFEKNIPVLGTNEHHPDLQTFNYIGHIATKLLYEADLEVLNSKILIVGGHEFGESILIQLNRIGANLKVVCKNRGITDQLKPFWLAESLASEKVNKFLSSADAIIFAEHLYESPLLGEGGELSTKEILYINDQIQIVHISGLIDSDELSLNGISIVPQSIPKTPRTMSVSTAYLGPKPIIELHTAGLKVGEEMATARLAGLSYQHTINKALKNNLCQDFSQDQLKRYLNTRR